MNETHKAEVGCGRVGTITSEQRADIQRREDALRAYLAGRCSYTLAEVEHLNPCTNEERSAAELYDWQNEKPRAWFAYPSDGLDRITNWMGATLAIVTWKGRPWRDNFGGERQGIRCTGTNGVRYAGTVYGTYCRLRALAE